MIPNVGEVDNLTKSTAEELTLKLASNDPASSEALTVASFTEVAGGGYASKSLPTSERTIVAGDPSTCTYPVKNFTFTGATNAPGVVYWYYIVNGAGVLKGCERFPSGVLPYTPVAGAQINITPTLKHS